MITVFRVSYNQKPKLILIKVGMRQNVYFAWSVIDGKTNHDYVGSHGLCYLIATQGVFNVLYFLQNLS